MEPVDDLVGPHQAELLARHRFEAVGAGEADDRLLELVSILAIPMIFAITLHEVAHGWVANKLGDPTARMLGRLSFNPIRHIDPVGTILVPGFLLLVGGFLFGWAKPVPVTPHNLRQHRYGMAWVAAAGPVSNILQALVWAVRANVDIHQPADNWFALRYVQIK